MLPKETICNTINLRLSPNRVTDNFVNMSFVHSILMTGNKLFSFSMGLAILQKGQARTQHKPLAGKHSEVATTPHSKKSMYLF